MLKESTTDALLQKKAIEVAAEATGELIGNKIANKLTKAQEIYHIIVQEQLQMKQKILDLMEKYLKNDIYPQIYIPRQQINDDLRFI